LNALTLEKFRKSIESAVKQLKQSQTDKILREFILDWKLQNNYDWMKLINEEPESVINFYNTI